MRVFDFISSVKTTCNIPQAPENGEALKMIYKEGSQAVYSCNRGYKLLNNDKQTCTASGVWTGRISPCIKGTVEFLILTIHMVHKDYLGHSGS